MWILEHECHIARVFFEIREVFGRPEDVQAEDEKRKQHRSGVNCCNSYPGHDVFMYNINCLTNEDSVLQRVEHCALLIFHYLLKTGRLLVSSF